jgi:hypothetical protein
MFDEGQQFPRISGRWLHARGFPVASRGERATSVLLPARGGPVRAVPPSRSRPRLAAYLREPLASGRVSGPAAMRVRPLDVQRRACSLMVRRLGGRHVPTEDVFIDAVGSRVGFGALLSAVREGFYDGVVVDSFSSILTGVMQALSLQQVLCSASCDLHVFACPAASLWGAGFSLVRLAAEDLEGRRDPAGLSVGAACLDDPRAAADLPVADLAERAEDARARREAVVRDRLALVEDDLVSGVLAGRARAEARVRRLRLERRLRTLGLARVRAGAVLDARGGALDVAG